MTLNGKKLKRNYNPEFRVQCQYCNRITRTRHLEHDILCQHCLKWAKRNWQKIRKKTIYDKTHRRYFVNYYIPKSQREHVKTYDSASRIILS